MSLSSAKMSLSEQLMITTEVKMTEIPKLIVKEQDLDNIDLKGQEQELEKIRRSLVFD